MNDDIKQAFREVLDERRSINTEEHHADHVALREFLVERQEKRERCTRIRERVAGSLFLSSIMGALTFLGWLGKWAMEHFHYK